MAELVINIKANNASGVVIDGARRDLQALGNTAETSLGKISAGFDSFGTSAQAVGGNLTRWVSLPLAGLGGVVTKFATDFNSQMANVASLGLLPERVQELKVNVQEMAVQFGQNTKDLSQGLYQVVSAFGDSSDSAAILETNAKAAAAGLATVTDAVNLTSAVTKGYGDTSQEAVGQVSDLAFQTVKLGQTTFPELASSIGRVTPLAAALGLAQEELFAVMATGTGVTGSAAEVSTQLRGVLQSMMAPTESMTALINAMGAESGAALIQQEGLQGAIELVMAAADATGEPLQNYISSIEGQTLALVMAGPQADTYKEKLAAMALSAGATETAFKAQTEGINATGFSVQQVGSEAQVLAQRLGDGLAPALYDLLQLAKPLIEQVLELAGQFASMDKEQQRTIATIGAIVVAIGPALAVIGTLASALGSIISVAGGVSAAIGGGGGVVASLGLLLNPVGLAIAAVGALALAWSTDFGGIRTETQTKARLIGEAVSALGDEVRRSLATAMHTTSVSWSAAWAGLVADVSHSASRMKSDALSAGRDTVIAIVRGVDNNAQTFRSALSSIAGMVSSTFRDKTNDWLGTGREVVAGIQNGVTYNSVGLINSLKTLGSSMLTTFKNSLGIRSPSALFAEAGFSISEGLAIGIQKGAALVSAAMQAQTDMMRQWHAQTIRDNQAAVAATLSAQQEVFRLTQEQYAVYWQALQSGESMTAALQAAQAVTGTSGGATGAFTVTGQSVNPYAVTTTMGDYSSSWFSAEAQAARDEMWSWLAKLGIGTISSATGDLNVHSGLIPEGMNFTDFLTGTLVDIAKIITPGGAAEQGATTELVAKISQLIGNIDTLTTTTIAGTTQAAVGLDLRVKLLSFQRQLETLLAQSNQTLASGQLSSVFGETTTSIVDGIKNFVARTFGLTSSNALADISSNTGSASLGIFNVLSGLGNFGLDAGGLTQSSILDAARSLFSTSGTESTQSIFANLSTLLNFRNLSSEYMRANTSGTYDTLGTTTQTGNVFNVTFNGYSNQQANVLDDIAFLNSFYGGAVA